MSEAPLVFISSVEAPAVGVLLVGVTSVGVLLVEAPLVGVLLVEVPLLVGVEAPFVSVDGDALVVGLLRTLRLRGGEQEAAMERSSLSSPGHFTTLKRDDQARDGNCIMVII